MKMFSFDDYLIANYLGDNSDQLALALQERVGGEIYAVHNSLIYGPMHYVLRKEDIYVDIEGVWTESELLEKWYSYKLEVSLDNQDIAYQLMPYHMVELPDVSEEACRIANKVASSLFQ